jgi:hypothetical protein
VDGSVDLDWERATGQKPGRIDNYEIGWCLVSIPRLTFMLAAGVGASCAPILLMASAAELLVTCWPMPAVGETGGEVAAAEAEPAGAEAEPAEAAAGTARRGQAPRNEKKFAKKRFASTRMYAGIEQSGCMPVSAWNFGRRSFSATLLMVFSLNLRVGNFLNIVDEFCIAILLNYGLKYFSILV